MPQVCSTFFQIIHPLLAHKYKYRYAMVDWSVVECGGSVVERGTWWSVVECGGAWWSVVERGGVCVIYGMCGAVSNVSFQNP